jgi:hypothetical protein
MQRAPAARPARPPLSASEIEALPALAAALSASIRLGAEPLERRIGEYLEARPRPDDDPIQKALSNLPGLCGDMIALSDRYRGLVHGLASPAPFRRVEVDLAEVLRRVTGPIGAGLGFDRPPESLMVRGEPDLLLLAFEMLTRGLGPNAQAPFVTAKRNGPGVEVVFHLPGRTTTPIDRYLLSDGLFPLPREATGQFVVQEIELTAARETLFLLGGTLALQADSGPGTVLKIYLPGA